MKAVTYERLGPPTDVLSLVDRPPRPPGPGEVQVEVLSAPIHNADCLQIMGLYGRSPSLPATPGGEGVGRVIAVGAGVEHLSVGTTVFITAGSTWAQQVTGPAHAFLPLPPGDLGGEGQRVCEAGAAGIVQVTFPSGVVHCGPYKLIGNEPPSTVPPPFLLPPPNSTCA